MPDNRLSNITSVTGLSLEQTAFGAKGLKDSYRFDFVSLYPKALEKDLEAALIREPVAVLEELGPDFALYGRQVRRKYQGTTKIIDLLFYNVALQCFVVVELKRGPYQRGFVRQVDLYLRMVTEHWGHQARNPPIGLILCRNLDRALVAAELETSDLPIAVAEYTVSIKKPSILQVGKAKVFGVLVPKKKISKAPTSPKKVKRQSVKV